MRGYVCSTVLEDDKVGTLPIIVCHVIQSFRERVLVQILITALVCAIRELYCSVAFKLQQNLWIIHLLNINKQKVKQVAPLKQRIKSVLESPL